MFASKSLVFSRQLKSCYSHNLYTLSTLSSHINSFVSRLYATTNEDVSTQNADNKDVNSVRADTTNISNMENQGHLDSSPSKFATNKTSLSVESSSSFASSFGKTSFGTFNIDDEPGEESALAKPKRPVNGNLTENDRVRQIRRRVRLYTQMLSQQPKTVTVNFTEKRTNTFCTIFSGKEPKMHLLSGFSVGQLLRVNKKARRTPQNTKIFVESIMRRRLPRIMAATNSTVINVRIRGTRKVAKPLIAELRTILQDQMKEVRETGSLSHPLWTVGSIKNITPYEMGSHKKRKRWRHL